MRFFAIALLLCGQLFAVTLQEIDSKEPGRAKNFLIWQYLQQDITPKEADSAFYQISDVSKKMFMAYAKRSSDPTVHYTAECWDADPKEILDPAKRDCLMIALTPYNATKLSLKERRRAAELLAQSEEEEWLLMMADPELSKRIESYLPETALRVCNSSGSTFRQECFNVPLSKEYLVRLAGSKGFNRFVQLVVMDEKMQRLQRSLLALEGDKLDAESNFYLAMNQLRFKNDKEALKHLDLAYDKAYFRMDKDKALFWKYLITKKALYLEALNSSFDINVYTLYANELTGRTIDNYFTSLSTIDAPAPVNLSDPFAWNRVLKTIAKTPKEELKTLAQQYRYKETYAAQAFILERAYGYRMHAFIMPYGEATAALGKDEKALLYALMRQESHFIPSALSSSYALGLMQLMPFLVRHLDKKLPSKTETLSEMFEPNKNIAYAIEHLDYLRRHLYHPLFVAYAYNGGIGFTKRMLEGGAFSAGAYEPFWSMEMMVNSESREYGKKVLANYVMYERIQGEKVSIRHLFDILDQPSQTDRFRK